jgi:hypothetical protein
MSQGSTVKQYPGAIDTFATWENDVDTIAAGIVNDIQDQVRAIETELGTDPAGTTTDVKTRLAVSIENNGNLKTNTVGTDQLNATAVTAAKLGADVAGNGLSGGNGSAISAQADATGGTNLAKSINVSSNGLAIKIDDVTIGENGSGRLYVKGLFSGIQKKTITVSAENGTFAFDFTDQSLSDYADTAYQVLLTTNGTNGTKCWATVSGAKATTGFTIALMTAGTNGSAPYNASSGGGGNVTVDVLTIHA